MPKGDLTELEKITIDTNNKFLAVHKVLCIHCKRTKYNNLSCIGKCVADNGY